MPGQPTQGEVLWRVAQLANAHAAPRLSSAPCLIALAVTLAGAALWNEAAAQSRREERLSRLRADFAFSVAPTSKPAAPPSENPLVPEPLASRELPRDLGVRRLRQASVARPPLPRVVSVVARPATEELLALAEADPSRHEGLASWAARFLALAVLMILAATLLPERESLSSIRRGLMSATLFLASAAAAG
ncbi:MAG: hypothetical protein HY553_12120, partial [Elusimicrobia bacterium]|nr:hypothetical protein [Elusimicrobiota bacterium]